MAHWDAKSHAMGQTLYVDDLPFPEDGLVVVPFESPAARGKLIHFDTSEAANMPGVVGILTAREIPGENQIGGIFPDEPLLAESEVRFRGQPLALVVAKSLKAAEGALKQIHCQIEETEPITCPREAHRLGSIMGKERTFQLGDIGKMQACAYVFKGTADVAGQEHLYLETQSAVAFPAMHGGVKIISSTQGPTAVQKHAAQVLALPMHKVEVEVTRLGGGFGGKEDQATPYGIMAAWAAITFQKPAKLVLDRMQDLRMTGKRNPYLADFTIGLDEDLKIQAYDVHFYQNAGAFADLSPAVLERTLFHATNAYFIPNVRARAASCRTNLPPNTAFRGFGGPQAMFVMESAIAMAAQELGVSAAQIQARNLLQDGDLFPYGQKVERGFARSSFAILDEKTNFMQRLQQLHQQPQTGRFRDGMAVMPICFGISFTKTHMNQAGALVHVYQDGSIGVSTGAVEMGQGVISKMRQVAAHCFGVDLGRVHVELTNTTRVANTSPSAASATADLNGKAVEIACAQILNRLFTFCADRFGGELKSWICRDGFFQGRQKIPFDELIQSAFLERVPLSAFGSYATPGIYFDPETEKGHPFAYHVYGAALFEVKVDTLLGTYAFDKVTVVHDLGRSINPGVDLGQIEGGLVQGLGWMTCEELGFDSKGFLQSKALSTYKVPDLFAAPREIEVHFLENGGDALAIRGSKAVGEPPLMYGIGAFFALRSVLKLNGTSHFHAPMTPERLFMLTHSPKARPV